MPDCWPSWRRLLVDSANPALASVGPKILLVPFGVANDPDIGMAGISRSIRRVAGLDQVHGGEAEHDFLTVVDELGAGAHQATVGLGPRAAGLHDRGPQP